jgi:SagB-type dehydrogenase family enzyme
MEAERMATEQSIGDRFQQETKYHRDRMPASGPNRAGEPNLYKEYPGSRRIELPKPKAAPAPLHELLMNRKSVRDFADTPISTEQLSYLLWASTGIQRRERGHEFRTAPSAGARYPIETYIAANSVQGLPTGLYHYAIQQHLLEELKQGDCGKAVADAALGQSMCQDAAAVFIWTAVFQRTSWRYGQRAYRYVYLDAGHIAANLALAAVAAGLGSCQIGALYDDEINTIIGVGGTDETVLYMSAVGVPARAQ